MVRFLLLLRAMNRIMNLLSCRLDFVHSEHTEASLELHYSSSEGADRDPQTWAAAEAPMFSTFL